MSIGERIAFLRGEKSMTQAQLADVMHVSRQAVSKWESDKTSPDTLNLIRLADVLDTELEYLATGNKPVYESPPIVVNVVEKVDKVVENVIEKPVIKKVIRYRYKHDPVMLSITGVAGLVVGFLIGFIM